MFRTLTAAAALIAACLGCQSNRSESAGAPVDDAGRGVALARPAQRIVSLAPSLTELLFAIGVGDRVVGRTTWCDYPPEVGTIPSVGDGLAPNIELIVSHRPDLVVFYRSPANDLAIQQLDDLGIATVSIRTDMLVDLERAARLLGKVLDAGERVDSLLEQFRAEMAALQDVRHDGDGPSALLLAWDTPPIVVGGSSFLSEIVDLAGGRNVFADVTRPSMAVSIESIVQRDPDLVLVTSDSGIPAWAGRPEWQGVAAVRERRFVYATGSEFARPTFRAAKAVQHLRRVFSVRSP